MKSSHIEEEVELIDCLRIIGRRRRLILLGIFLPLITVGIIGFFRPPVYEATAQVRVGRVWEKEIENPYLIVERIMGDAFLSEVIQRFNLSASPQQIRKGKVIEVNVIEGGIAGQKLALLISIEARSSDPKTSVDIVDMVANLIIQESKGRFEEKLNEYKAYEEELDREVKRIEEQIDDLGEMIKKQQFNPTVSAPSVILLQAQLEQKSVQLLAFKKELKDTRINNVSSIVTESTKLISPPFLPKYRVNSGIELKMGFAAILGFSVTLMLSFFLEYLVRVRARESKSRFVQEKTVPGKDDLSEPTSLQRFEKS